MDKKITVGVAMIAKNEMEFIARALDSVQGADQIVVCDTGSTDNGETVRIAREHGATVYEDYQWEDSFCKARNHVKSKMTTDWILSLDCDEYLHDFSRVRRAVEFAEANNIKAIDILQHAEDHTSQTNTFPRLFKNSPDIVWHGAAHNYLSLVGTLIVENPDGSLRIGNSQDENDKNNAVVHLTYGYSLAHLQDPDRTMRILEKAVANPEESGAGSRELFYLGREYWYRRLFDKAIPVLERYIQESRFLSEKAEAYYLIARAKWEMSDGEGARDAVLQALKINPHFKEAAWFMSQIVWPKHSGQWLNMAKTADNTDVLFVRKVDL